MAKKSYDYNVLSEQTCEYPGCTIRLKLRLVQTKKHVKYCYKHYMASKLSHGLDHKNRQHDPKHMSRKSLKKLASKRNLQP